MAKANGDITKRLSWQPWIHLKFYISQKFGLSCHHFEHIASLRHNVFYHTTIKWNEKLCCNFWKWQPFFEM